MRLNPDKTDLFGWEYERDFGTLFRELSGPRPHQGAGAWFAEPQSMLLSAAEIQTCMRKAEALEAPPF
jgi:hypothetical protein